VGASVVMHAALAVLAVPPAGRGPADAPVFEGRLAATLAKPTEAVLPERPLPLVLPLLQIAPLRVPLLPVATLSRLPEPHRAAPAPGGASGIARIEGQLLAGRERVGALVDRQLLEFPREIDTPARIRDPIAAPYPAAALAAGREDAVVVWAIVDPDGTVDEVDVTEGTPEFAEAVVAAVKAARFTPATNKLKPIRYPIALEFRFALAQAPGATASAQ
jgi:TonB family protein